MSDEELHLVVPSRGRPGNVRRLAGAIEATATLGMTTMTVVVDHDDPLRGEYCQAAAKQWWKVVVQHHHRKLGPVLNAAAVPLACRHPYIAFMGDDHLPRTVGWDMRLMGALGGRPGIAYGDDLFQGPNLPTAVVMSSDLIRVLGYMQPPQLVHLYFDDFWKKLGQDIGNLQYRPDVIIEHLHPIAGKAAWSPEYAWTTSAELLNEDGWRYQEYLRDEWPAALARLKEVLGLG